MEPLYLPVFWRFPSSVVAPVPGVELSPRCKVSADWPLGAE